MEETATTGSSSSSEPGPTRARRPSSASSASNPSTGRLDQKGHRGRTSNSVQRRGLEFPFLVSKSRLTGPPLETTPRRSARVELAGTGKRAVGWPTAHGRSTTGWTVGSPAEISRAVRRGKAGYAPTFPAWAARLLAVEAPLYRTQDELLGRSARAPSTSGAGLPLSVIVCDFFHWPHHGDWCFEPERMAPILVRPAWSMSSTGYGPRQADGSPSGRRWGTPCGELCRDAARWDVAVHRDGARKHRFHTQFPDRGSPVRAPPVSFYDATNPRRAAAYLWPRRSWRDQNYHASSGSTVFWLDAARPRDRPGQTENLRLHSGPGPAVIKPVSARSRPSGSTRDGMREEGAEEILTLCRSSPGRAANGTARRSGRETIAPTFEALAAQIPGRAEHGAPPESRGGRPTHRRVSTGATPEDPDLIASSSSAGSSSMALCGARSFACTDTASRVAKN